MEIERQWLVDVPIIPNKDDERVTDMHRMEQSYLQLEPEIRVRKKHTELSNRREIALVDRYYLTFKSNGGLSRIEVEKEITDREYEELLRLFSVTQTPINKLQYVMTVKDAETGGDYKAELNFVDKGTANEFVYVEVEFSSEKEAKAFKAPVWFGKEVTYDSSYKMKNIWKKTRLGGEYDEES